jgi:hypothetical protein
MLIHTRQATVMSADQRRRMLALAAELAATARELRGQAETAQAQARKIRKETHALAAQRAAASTPTMPSDDATDRGNV